MVTSVSEGEGLKGILYRQWSWELGVGGIWWVGGQVNVRGVGGGSIDL